MFNLTHDSNPILATTYGAKAESKWDTDSDSNESDEEDLKQ